MLTRCCCCSLRAGSIVVGVLAMVVAFIFFPTGIYVTWAWSRICIYNYFRRSDFTGETRRICVGTVGLDKVLSNLFAFLTFWNGLEICTSAGLIWGASKRSSAWVTAWLMSSVCWIALHAALTISYLFSENEIGFIVLTSVLGIFFLVMSLLALFTVGSFHNELSKESATSRGYVYPPTHVQRPPPYPPGVSVVTYGGYPYGQPPPSEQPPAFQQPPTFQQPPPFQPSPQMPGAYSTKTSPPGTMDDWTTTK